MEFQVLTVFPQLYRPFRRQGILAKALDEERVSLDVWSLRRFTPDDYGEIDDRAYGGEFGMVMKPEPYFRGVDHIRRTRGEGPVILTAADGEPFTNEMAKDLSQEDRLLILTGRYEGVDQRVRDQLVDRTVSIGPYVTPGGDLPALVIVSSIVRHVPGVVSNPTSVEKDSYQDGQLAPPHYTRPSEFRGHAVPDVLRSGDHERIRAWRREQARRRTRAHRPELLEEPGSNDD